MIGLPLNTGKTEILTSYIEDIHEVKSLSGNVLKQVDHFKYLGAYMPDSSYDFNTEKCLAWAAVNKLDCIWKSNMDKKLKVKFFRSCVESILLYNSETWTVTGNLEKQIDGLYTKLLRRILGVRWRDHVTNKELYGDIPLLSAQDGSVECALQVTVSVQMTNPYPNLYFGHQKVKEGEDQ